MLQLNPLKPLLILTGAIFVSLLFFLFLVRKYYQSKNLRLPFTQNLLRAPGQSILNKINHLNQELMVFLVFLIFTPTYAYAAYISYLFFGKKPFNITEMAIFALFPIILILFSLYKMSKYLGLRRRLRLGYDGEVAVGQNLTQLYKEGYLVYHDFPADNFNIDHIVIGSKGVFAIETKARSKPTSKNRLEDATVEYNGRVLQFPKGRDSDTIEQTNRQADWLATWLSNAVGEPVVVRGIVALPGWYVKRTSAEGIPVVNPKQFASLFEYIQPRFLSEETIKRVVHQIEQKCRDVEPVSTIYESEQE
jgi:hypothetical protein